MPRKRTPYFIKWPSNVFTRPKYVNSCADLGRNALIECSEKDPATLPDELTQLLKINSGESLIDNFYLYRDETDPTEKLKLWVNIFATLQILRPYFEDIDTRMSAPEFSDFFLNAFSDLKTWTEQYKDAADIKEIANRDFLGLPAGGKSRTAADSFFNSLSAAEREEIAEMHNLEKFDSLADIASLPLEIISAIKNKYTPGFLSIANTQQLNLVERMLAAGFDDFQDLADRMQKTSKGATQTIYKQSKDGTEHTLVTTTQNNVTQAIMRDPVSKGNKTVKKIWDLSINKAAAQLNADGQIDPDKLFKISVPLEELVSLGIYSDIESARNGFVLAASYITDIKISYRQTEYQKGKRVSVGAKGFHLFPEYELPQYSNIGYLSVLPRTEWDNLMKYYTYMPEWAFKLSSRGYDLMRYISVRGRRQGKDILENGYIDISLRTIQMELHLPNEKEVKNPKRDIKDEIQKAINEILTQAQNDFIKIELLPAGIEKKRAAEFLDRGFLRVYISGKYADKLTAPAKHQKRIIENKKRAKARAIAKNAEKKDKSKD